MVTFKAAQTQSRDCVTWSCEGRGGAGRDSPTQCCTCGAWPFVAHNLSQQKRPAGQGRGVQPEAARDTPSALPLPGGGGPTRVQLPKCPSGCPELQSSTSWTWLRAARGPCKLENPRNDLNVNVSRGSHIQGQGPPEGSQASGSPSPGLPSKGLRLPELSWVRP